jgi:hypothetical protein
VNNAITVVTITIVTITRLANNVVVIANIFASFFLFPPRTLSLPSPLLVSLWLGPSSPQLLSPPPFDCCTVFLFFFLSPTASPLSGGLHIIAVIATNIVNNAITVVTITIVPITKLANIVGVIANVFASFIISVFIKNIVIAITAVSFIMVRSIKSNIVVTSSLRLLSCFHYLFSFTDSVTTVRWVTNIIAVIATNIVNSLTAIDGHDRQYFNELRSTVVSYRIFIRLQSLIAR